MSEVTICNLALAHIGDTATVASIKPPDSSVQAQLCARFYWIARNALLEMGSWGFATRRIKLAEVERPACHHTWCHAYAAPAGMVNTLAVLPDDAPDDYEARLGALPADYFFPPFAEGYQPLPGAEFIVPRPYVVETLQSGAQVILTNEPCAVLRYTALVTDTTKFSPLFQLALSYLLGSMLAGPILKGDAGAEMGAKMLELFNSVKNMAVVSDANQRRVHVQPATPWIGGR